jgi:hypothetical protein
MQPADVGGGWTMKVNSFNANADADVAAENQFNDPPPAGSHYALVNVELTYNGVQGKDSSYWFGQAAVLGTKNVPHTESDVSCVAPNELERSKEVFKGGTISGNMCIALPEDEQGFVLYAAGDLGQSKKTFFALA